jgi:hypothetical protein
MQENLEDAWNYKDKKSIRLSKFASGKIGDSFKEKTISYASTLKTPISSDKLKICEKRDVKEKDDRNEKRKSEDHASNNGSRFALGQAFAQKFFLNIPKKDDEESRPSTASILFKHIHIEGGSLAKALQSIVAKTYVEKKEYEIKFNFLRWIKIFIYHLWWFCFGYLFGFVLCLIEGKSKTKNMGFLLGKHVKLGSAQTIAHVCFITFILTSFLLPTKGLNYGDRLFIILIIVTRSFIIGVRYGFMSDARYNLMKKDANFEWITNDFLFLGWLKLSPKTLKQEIEATKHRTQIIEQEFTFTFIQTLNSELAEKFQKEDYYEINKFDEKELKSKINIQKSVIFKKRKETWGSIIDDEFEIIHDIEKGKLSRRKMLQRIESEHESEKTISPRPFQQPKVAYKGATILREMGLLESGVNSSSWPLMIVVAVRISLPIFVLILNNNYGLALYWYEYLMLLWSIIIIVLIYGVNLTFIYAGIIDFRRKLFFMKILHSMITPDKDKYFAFSTFFPTLNICHTQNLNSWMILRTASLDLGKKYTQRIFMYCSVFMAFYLSFFVFLLLSFLGILNYKLPLIVYMTGMYDVMIILGIILVMIKLGAQVNEFSDIHKGIFINLKKQFWDAKNHYHSLIVRNLSRSPTQKVFRDLLKTMNIAPMKRNEYFDEWIALLDIINENLDYNKQTRPLKLMGLTASKELLNSIYTAIVSIIFAISQVFYSSLIENANV